METNNKSKRNEDQGFEQSPILNKENNLKEKVLPKTKIQTVELGLGKSGNSSSRMVNQDGTFNVIRTGVKNSFFINIYHQLIVMPWIYFLGIITGIYLTINLTFASLYIWAGETSLQGLEGLDFFHQFWEAFFFSTQTFTTVGYGRISPIGILPNAIASVESYFGLLGFAIATGLLYGKFSRPRARILFSKNLLLSPYQNTNALVFRMVNSRSNQLIDVTVVVYLSYLVEVDGVKIRKFDQIKLERDFINFFPYNWHIVHPIDELSPVSHWKEKDFEESNMEMLILVRGTDETYNQSVHDRTSFKYEDMKFGKKFSPMFYPNQSGINEINLEKINDLEIAPLNI